MTNFDIMKDFIQNLDEDEDIQSLRDEYELSDSDNSKLTKGLVEKAIDFDEKGKVLSLEEWKELYKDTAVMVTSFDYDLSTGKRKPRPKNFIPKFIDLAIDKLGNDSKDYDDSYDDGNKIIK